MTRPRDTQRTKLLAAEEEFMASGNYERQTRPKFTSVVAKFNRSAWWKKRQPEMRLGIVPTRATAICATSGGDLQLGQHVNLVDVCHAIAHYLHPEDSALHGPEFAKAMLDVVGKMIGLDERRRLAAAYKTHGIKTVTWSPEAKQRLKERHAESDLKALLEELKPEGVTPSS